MICGSGVWKGLRWKVHLWSMLWKLGGWGWTIHFQRGFFIHVSDAPVLHGPSAVSSHVISFLRPFKLPGRLRAKPGTGSASFPLYSVRAVTGVTQIQGSGEIDCILMGAWPGHVANGHVWPSLENIICCILYPKVPLAVMMRKIIKIAYLKLKRAIFVCQIDSFKSSHC